MKKARIVCLLLPLLTLIFPAMASAEPPPVSPPETQSQGRFGIVEAYEAPNLAQAAGARWERLYFWWNQIQPNDPQEWRASQVVSGPPAHGKYHLEPSYSSRRTSVDSHNSYA